MKRILVTGAANIGSAGVATIVYKWGQQFDSKKLVYDYLMQSGIPDEVYVKNIMNKGGHIFTLKGSKSIGRILSWISYIVNQYDYDTIHINSDSAYIAAAYIYAAKRGGIKHIYVHSHCTEIDENNKLKRRIKTILHKICIPYVCRNTEKFLACSKMAGRWMFGNRNIKSDKYKTIYNGVEPNKYFFDKAIRESYRKQLCLDNSFVIGNIGRFSYQKNHNFLLDVFKSYLEIDENSILILVGEGELEQKIKEKARRLGIIQKIKFLGRRDDIPQLLSAMDIMVMPSRFEGLPVTMVEAQMASLPCIVSSSITREAQFTGNVIFINGYIDDEWAKEIKKFKINRKIYHSSLLIESDFNIGKSVRTLQKILIGEDV